MRIISEPFNIITKEKNMTPVCAEYNPDGSVKVLNGSLFRNFETNTLLQGYRNKRKELIENGYVDVINQRFIKDYVFNNACEAYCCCHGRQDNGIAKFYTIDNIELNKFLKDSKKRYYLDKDDEKLVISTENVDDESEVVPVSEKEKREVYSFKRRRQFVKQALEESNYQCEIDSNHMTFFTKYNKPYMEAHHLIPLSTQELFDTSGLDNIANIVCVCPNCHRNLHYGNDIELLLKKLYDSRKQALEDANINITFEELKQLY